MNRITLSIVVLFILILIVYIPGWLKTDDDAFPKVREDAWRPNYQAHNMRSTFFDKQGDVNHLVFARKMEHYQLLGFTFFEQPQYTIFVASQSQPWHLAAKEGTLHENDIIRLEQDVEIRTLFEGGVVQTIRTEFLEVNLKDKTMMSDQPVEIVGQNFVINSNGFTGDLVTQQYEFKDHVQTVYAPE